ncbi:MAG TPA: hypothetical protein VMT15_03090 [Bryobacteraceae bacterium]|nr:hypothetical protein [Bryobacteraceae bacterium]
MTRRHFLFSASAIVYGQAAQTQAEIRGRKVIDNAIAALGGNAFLTMADRTEVGRAYSYYREEISGLSVAKIYTRYLTVPPDKVGSDLGQREKEVFGKDEDTSVLFLEDRGWETSWRGSKQMEPDRFERYKDTTLRNVLYIFRQRLKEPGMIFEMQGSDVVDNLPVDIVDITDSEDRVLHVHFHQSTKLPVRQIYKRKNPVTKEQDDEVTLFGRYFEAGGVQWPRQIRRERNGEKVYEIFAESVKINSGFSDNLFSEPDPGAKPSAKPKKK